MDDTGRLIEMISTWTRNLVAPFQADDVLRMLTSQLTAAFGLSGAAVVLVADGALRHAGVFDPAHGPVERLEEHDGSGPCHDALTSGEVVAVDDLERMADRWPDYVIEARKHDVAAVVGLPLTLAGTTLGALNLFNACPRRWSADLPIIQVFADLASGYLLGADVLARQLQTIDHLQRALESRVVIEQAKGMVAEANSISIAVAFERIRRHARGRQTSVREVASAIVELGLRV